MLRISQYVRDALQGRPFRKFEGTILIWNLTSGCNLRCAHCYADAVAGKGAGIALARVRQLAPQVAQAGVRSVVLSGGEPLLRKDLFEIAALLRAQGLATSLSTNGLLIDDRNLEAIAEAFDYVGISIDGEPTAHDQFRGLKGAYQRSLESLRRCRDRGISTGIRFTLSAETQRNLPFVLALARQERLPKVYVSHLVNSGRGEGLRSLDRAGYERAIQRILSFAFEGVASGRGPDVVTGNNESDAVWLLREFGRRYPHRFEALRDRLLSWGGNQAGVRLLNIDARGELKPDPFFEASLGNVLEHDLGELLGAGDPLAQGLCQAPRALKGRCQGCEHLAICNGNSRARAFAASGDYFAEDPACFV